MSSELANRIARLLAGQSGGLPLDQVAVAPQVQPPVQQPMLYGQQPAPMQDVPMNPAIEALRNRFAFLNLLRNQRDDKMNQIQGIDQQGG